MSVVIANERGIALVITLLVVSLLAIIVVEFTYSVEIDQHMARNALSGLQASLLARSGINLGEAFLLHDKDATIDAFTEEWCPEHDSDAHSCKIDETNSQLIVPENMRLRVKIVDESGKLNINLVAFRNPPEWNQWRNAGDDPTKRPPRLEGWRAAFERLLESRGLDAQIADEFLAYCDKVYEAKYGSTNPGATPGAGGFGRPAGTPSPNPTPGSQTTNSQALPCEFPSLDDASVVPGFTPNVIRRLRPVVTALPSAQQLVNANTALPEVLRAIVANDEVVSNIVSQRTEKPLDRGELFGLVSSANQPGATPRGSMLGVTSSFFLVRASAVVNPNPVTGRGGISRSASMLVRRIDRRTARSPGRPGAVPWTLTQLDWQKEGGAVLFMPNAEQEPGTEDPSVPGSAG